MGNVRKGKIKSPKNVFKLVSKLTTDIENVEKSFDNLVSQIKEEKIRAFSCVAITLDGDVLYNYACDNNNMYSLIGATELMKQNLIKQQLDLDNEGL